jgi:hypothetical protein
MDIILLGPEHIELAWPSVEPLLYKALDYSAGEWKPEDFKENLLEGLIDLFIATKESRDTIVAMACTQVVHYPQYKSLRINALAGDSMGEWFDEETFEEHAQKKGCHSIELFGRKGWLRVADKKGYKEQYVVMTKVLESKGE